MSPVVSAPAVSIVVPAPIRASLDFNIFVAVVVVFAVTNCAVSARRRVVNVGALILCFLIFLFWRGMGAGYDKREGNVWEERGSGEEAKQRRMSFSC